MVKYFLIKLDKLYHRRIFITSNDTKHVFSILKRKICFKYYQIVTNLNLLIIINDWWITNFIYLRNIIPPFIFRRLIDKFLGNFLFDYNIYLKNLLVNLLVMKVSHCFN